MVLIQKLQNLIETLHCILILMKHLYWKSAILLVVRDTYMHVRQITRYMAQHERVLGWNSTSQPALHECLLQVLQTVVIETSITREELALREFCKSCTQKISRVQADHSRLFTINM